MSLPDQIALHLPAKPGYEKVAMGAAGSIARGMGFPEERVQDLRMALGEACLNAIEHGAGGRVEERIEVVFTVETGEMEVQVRDPGQGGALPLEVPDLARKLSGEDPSPRGWGFHIIQRLVDEASFTQLEEGAVLRMSIRLHTDEEGE